MEIALLTEEEVDALVSDEPALERIDSGVLADPVAARALRVFLVLTDFAEQFLQSGWSPECIFWSRYYWFRRFADRRIKQIGADAGLEQQAFKILEQPFPMCSPDWSQLASVERKAVVA